MTCSEDIHSMSMDIINILIKYEVLLIERSTVYTSWINVLRLNNGMEGAKHCGDVHFSTAIKYAKRICHKNVS